jgi:hypothetical protein
MIFKVLHEFKEKEHENNIYGVGDTYPKEGFNADEKRVSYLQGVHPEYRVRFLDSAPKVKEPKELVEPTKKEEEVNPESKPEVKPTTKSSNKAKSLKSKKSGDK